MTIDQLKSLKTIVEEGSFRSAAERLNKAQSAVSYSISKLEDQLNIKIFDRSSYRPELTEKGRLLYEQAKKVLSEYQQFSDMGATLSQGVEAILHLGISAPFSIERIIPCFNRFNEEMPRTRLKISIEVLATLERLMAGEIDLAVSELPNHPQLELDSLELETMQLVPVAKNDHPLAKIQGEISESDLMNHPHIVLRSTATRGKEKSAGVLEGATTWSVSDYLTKKSLLLGGAGWGTMPRHLVNDEIKQGSLRLLNAPAYKDLFIKFYLIKQKSKVMGPAAQYLWQSIETQCRSSKKNTGKGG